MNISFLDFWDPFDPSKNFFIDLFKDIYGNVELSHPSDSDVIFYGPFGNQHSVFNPKEKVKIFVTGENVRPDFNQCTYSFSFDFEDYGGKYIRLPLWFLQIDWFGKGGYGNPEFMMPLSKLITNEYIETPKTKFCVLMSNKLVQNRVDCVNKLNLYKNVDCYGKPFGNWQYGESQKYDVFSKYKFSICFENSFAPNGGYYTEKLIHAKLAGTIPLYYADDKVGRDFNIDSFINLNDFKSMDEFVARVVEVDNDNSEYLRIKNSPLFKNNPDESTLQELKNKVKELFKI